MFSLSLSLFLYSLSSQVLSALGFPRKELLVPQLQIRSMEFFLTWVCLYVTTENQHQQFSTSGRLTHKGPPVVTSA